jgi:ferredoxin-NADP reductase
MAPHLDFSPPLRLVVHDREDLADGVVGITLTSPDGAALPRWEPGSHITLRMSETLDREYSLCGDVEDTKTWRIAVRVGVKGRGGAEHVDRHLHPGVEVGVTRLANLFRYEPQADPLFIAGGIGITPLIPMMQAAQMAGTAWDLIYIGSDRPSMAFLASLEQLGGRVHVVETTHSGRPNLVELLDKHAARHIFCCGPAPMLDLVESHTLGWTSRHVDGTFRGENPPGRRGRHRLRSDLGVQRAADSRPGRQVAAGSARRGRRGHHVLMQGRHVRFVRGRGRGRPPRSP